ncbi:MULTISPECIES: SDR family oxidoreductase [unclassified Lentimicrobium]|uniref:SDR family oxidoreductase n=1 Tax=unclassified Lentimicrobium TaxID=2677434 RepID=UPI001553ABE7|nr:MULTISPECIES: SDR family oxidoreductase [unclassified Lentimicrobium]NPD44607.1 SDR family oxidoreductase [Lentimicrobium sp. S6]NPD83319.1 SDR family oxidoreductase [Lentimicrobium sp. L6]
MKNIIITGASRGIGKAAALKLAQEENIRILVIARSAEKLEELKDEVPAGAELLIYPFDLNNGEYEKLKQFIGENFNSVDLLINNAGSLVVKPFMEMTEDDFDLQFQINAKSVFHLSKICIPLMPKGSHIVNISSMGGFQGSMKFPGLSLYSASKGAVSILTESLAAELVEQGISVNALAFGAVDTDMLRSAFPDYQAPLNATEMGEYLADFALTKAKFYNGKVLPVSVSTP